MSLLETYLLDLRAALNDRLPTAVTEARLREARAHLLASAEDIGEAEAIRRYGRPRAIATDLVRAHRGYDARSAWALALPLVLVLLTCGVLVSILAMKGFAGAWTPLIIVFGRTVSALIAAAFLVRVTQTRRWLAGPMIVEHIASVAFTTLLNLRHGMRWSPPLGTFVVFDFAMMSVVWLTLNALALTVGRLLDMQSVRRAGSTR